MKYDKSISLYKWCVNTLIEAYILGNLEPGLPCECGVGNLLIRRYKDIHGVESYFSPSIRVWTEAFSTIKRAVFEQYTEIGGLRRLSTVVRSNDTYCQVTGPTSERAEQILKILPLSRECIMDIEWAFESNQLGEREDERILNGLCATIEVLDKYFGVERCDELDELITSRTSFINEAEAKLDLLTNLETIPNTIQHDRSSSTNKTILRKVLAHQVDS